MTARWLLSKAQAASEAHLLDAACRSQAATRVLSAVGASACFPHADMGDYRHLLHTGTLKAAVLASLVCP
jgi:hypothetical protein